MLMGSLMPTNKSTKIHNNDKDFVGADISHHKPGTCRPFEKKVD